MRWLCVEARFLAGRYHGRSDNGRRHQWPPDPYRLFQAMIAAGNLGFRRTEFSDAKKDALRWLERREAPEIVSPLSRQVGVVRLYVPNNDMDKVARFWAKGQEPEKQPNELRTSKDFRPHHLEGDTALRFLWAIGDDEWQTVRPHAELLCGEARHLHALGLGIDLVAGNGHILSDDEKQALPGEAWIADCQASGWRVPVEGSLDELLARHDSQRERVRMQSGRRGERWVYAPAPPTVFREVGYARRSAPRGRRVHAYALMDEDDDYRSFDPRRTIEVAAWLRHAAHESARGLKLDPDFIDCFVCGHGDDEAAKSDRFSYLPLPTIPAKGRDGRIRRILIAEPIGGGGNKARALARRLSGAYLVSDDTGEVMAYLRTIPDPSADPIARRYLQESLSWATVTPLVLPGHDDHRSRKACGLVLKALAQAGYTTPVSEIHLQPEPIFPGAEMARAYRAPSYLKRFPRAHVIITFAQPVGGPVVIGGGRHLGLGVFAACRSTS